jgi:hypothetical protein
VETQKIIVIITDGIDSTQELAERIRKELKGYRIIRVLASDFSGTDILPGDVLFLGCKEANPPSFVRLEKVLGHINLAGRSCGLFSPGSKEAVRYLAGIVQDSELILASKPLFASNGSMDITDWIDTVISLRRA